MSKIFKSKSLKESQKVKVLKAFDKATTVKEAKMIYETLNTGIDAPTTRSKRNMNFASQQTSKAKARKPLNEAIVKVDPMVSYFNKIAFGEE